MKKNLILIVLFILFIVSTVAAQRPQPLSSLERSLSPNMMMMSNASRYAGYSYFNDWINLYGDSLNILNPFWLGSILPTQNVSIAAAGNNLLFSQGGIFSFVADTSLTPFYNYQFNINPKISGGQGLFRAQNVSNGYYNGLFFNQLGLTLFADNNLVLANPQVQIGLTPGVYEAEFDESGALSYVEKDTCGVGECWTISSTENSGFSDIVYGNNLFVAVANGGTNRIFTSPDGVNFTPRSIPSTFAIQGVTYGNGLFVAVGASPNLLTSIDGVNWNSSSSPLQANKITYGNGRFVMVSSSGANTQLSAYSDDGLNWSLSTTPTGNFWSDVTHGNGLFVAVASSGTGGTRIMTSPDGVAWTQQTNPDSLKTWQSVTYANGLFVAVGRGTAGGKVITSPDGVTWTQRNSADDSNDWYSIAYGNGKFVAVAGSGSGKVMTSKDGINWKLAVSANESNSWRSIAYGNGLFVALSVTGSLDRAMKTGLQDVSSYEPNNIEQGPRTFTGDTIIYSNYPNTRNDTGTPSNLLATSSAGVMQSNPLSEIFAALSAQNTSDQTLTTGVNNAIRFQNTSFTSGSNITITNDTLITINQTGVYELSFDGRFDASASTENTSVQFVATNVADMGANFAFSILTTESVIPMKRIFQVTAVPATIRVIQEATTWASGSVICSATSSLNIKRLY